MEKLKKVLDGFIHCFDHSLKCEDCPYHRQCEADNECEVMLEDARELLTELMNGTLQMRLVYGIQEGPDNDPEPAHRDEPAKHLTCEDVEDCINLIDEIRSILVSGRTSEDEEPEDPRYFSSGMSW